MLQIRNSAQAWLWVAILLLICIDLVWASNTLASGFDFPLGKPDGVGYGVQSLGGLDFLDPYDYGGNCGWTFHPGEDWNADGSGLDFGGDSNDAGDPVYAASDGVITYAQFAGNSWGFVVLIRHDGSFNLPEGGQVSRVWSQYGHLANISNNPRSGEPWRGGDAVFRGEQIGSVGDFPYGSGQAFHLHFEIRKIDLPGNFFPCKKPKSIVELWYTRPTAFIVLNPEVAPPLNWITCEACPEPPEISVSGNTIVLGVLNLSEGSLQNTSVHGVSALLPPASNYSVTFSFSLSTWDSYNAPGTPNPPYFGGTGWWDSFSVSVSQAPYWQLGLTDPVTTTNLPGLGFLWGGTSYGDGSIEIYSGTITVSIPGNPTGTNYLNVVLDTASLPNANHNYASWGTITILNVKTQ